MATDAADMRALSSDSVSPRRSVAIFVGAAWIVGVLCTWSLLRLSIVGGYAKVEKVAASERLSSAAQLLDLQMRQLDRGAWALAHHAGVSALVGEQSSGPIPDVLRDTLDQGDYDALVVVDHHGMVRFRDVRNGEDAVATALGSLPQQPGTGTFLENTAAGPVLTLVRPVPGPRGDDAGFIIATLLLDESRLAATGAPYGLELSVEPAALGTPGGATIDASGRLLVRENVPLPDGQRALVLQAESPRAVSATGQRVFSMLLVGFAVASALGGLLAVRMVSALLHRESDRLYSEFVERSGEGMLLVEPNTLRIRLANESVRRLLGREDTSILSLTLPEAVPLSTTATLTLRGLLGGARASLGEFAYRPSASCDARQLEVAASCMTWRDEEMLCVVVRDVTDRHVEEARTRHLAWHDLLTGLPNRALFSDRLRDCVATAEKSGELLGVAFVDIDQFKDINDTFGHDVADRLLIDVAQRLREGVRSGDIVARQGGDEFLVAMPSISQRGEAAGLAERILALFRRPFNLDGRELHLTASVGVSMYPDDGRDSTELVKHADMAMYQAKETGRDGWQLFDPHLRERTAKLVDTRARLVHALERNEFILHYQPQVDLRSGQVIGVEALIRWMSDGKMVAPMDFIPLAEQTGLIGPIGAWVLEEACRQAREWQDRGLPPLRVAVNLSARQFLAGTVQASVSTALAKANLDAKWLEVEITESLAMKNPEVARGVLADLRKRGVTVALDDFGTGYSSLAYLRQFTIDRLKIDKGFLAGAVKDTDQRALVRAIIQLSHAIKLEVVAEGIETLSQLEVLTIDGCDIGQGYGLCKPVAAAEIANLLSGGLNLVERLRPRAIA